jgi:predicted nucleotidyltransferase
MKTIPPDLLAEITRRLVVEFRPEQIILFGSHAWGAPNEDSDVDLCVIVSQSEEKPIQRAVRAQHCMDRLLVPADILVKTRAEVDRYCHIRASLERKILQQGRVLFHSFCTPSRSSSTVARWL